MVTQGNRAARRIRVSKLPVVALSILAATAQVILPGDVNGDGHVDRLDIELISAARGTPALGPSDPRDINRDGKIDGTDVRLATGLCTRPNCALPSASISVNSSPMEIVLTRGQVANFSTNVSYTAEDTTSRNVIIFQTVEPDNGGITLLQGITPGSPRTVPLAN